MKCRDEILTALHGTSMSDQGMQFFRQTYAVSVSLEAGCLLKRGKQPVNTVKHLGNKQPHIYFKR